MCEYTVITHDNLILGIFSKIVGVMTAQGLQILDARIITRDDGVVVDTFKVSDPDYVGVPPVERRVSITATIVRVLKGEEEVDQLMNRNTRMHSVRHLPATLHATEVQIDNETSERSTIIDVFADDTQGLLYAITRSIFQLGLSVHAARISHRQEVDQVVDVFYVKDRDGAKIEDHARLEAIRATIKQDIDLFMAQPADASEGVSIGSSV
jgi:[protein-PII] uridylyltransferase